MPERQQPELPSNRQEADVVMGRLVDEAFEGMDPDDTTQAEAELKENDRWEQLKPAEKLLYIVKYEYKVVTEDIELYSEISDEEPIQIVAELKAKANLYKRQLNLLESAIDFIRPHLETDDVIRFLEGKRDRLLGKSNEDGISRASELDDIVLIIDLIRKTTSSEALEEFYRDNKQFHELLA